MRIAVCDDEQEYIDKTTKTINQILKSPFDYTISGFLNGRELLKSHRSNPFDIIFLDIEMSGLNGMETAQVIRESDKKAIIVFLTSYHEFAVQGYEVNAYRYIIKKQPDYIYEKQFTSIFNEYSQNQKTFTITDKKMTVVFNLCDICYFEVINKTVNVCTMGGNYEYNDSLSSKEEYLRNDGFVKVRNSILVNLANIDMITKNEILLKNKKTVPLSRGYKESVQNSYLSYMSGR